MQKCGPLLKARCRRSHDVRRAGRPSRRTRAGRGWPSRRASAPSRRRGSRRRRPRRPRASSARAPAPTTRSAGTRRARRASAPARRAAASRWAICSPVSITVCEIRPAVVSAATGDDDEAEAEDVPVGQPLAVDLGGDQPTEQVVAGFESGGGDRRGEVLEHLADHLRTRGRLRVDGGVADQGIGVEARRSADGSASAPTVRTARGRPRAGRTARRAPTWARSRSSRRAGRRSRRQRPAAPSRRCARARRNGCRPRAGRRAAG